MAWFCDAITLMSLHELLVPFPDYFFVFIFSYNRNICAVQSLLWCYQHALLLE